MAQRRSLVVERRSSLRAIRYRHRCLAKDSNKVAGSVLVRCTQRAGSSVSTSGNSTSHRSTNAADLRRGWHISTQASRRFLRCRTQETVILPDKLCSLKYRRATYPRVAMTARYSAAM
jgi:hypothetical protein